MKIFYAVQATGNGHISRAIQLMPYLEKFGTVDVLLSGANATLDAPLPIKYRSKGVVFFYGKWGGLTYKKMWGENSILKATRGAKQLPRGKYDIILNDFDFITANACSIKGLSSVQFGHQASFMSAHAPRPAEKSVMGELILKKYAPATHYVGLHFQQYDSFIYPAVIKDIFRHGDVSNKGHITVYLPAYQQHCIEQHLQSLAHVHFHWFLHGIKKVERKGNITYFPIDNELFNGSLMRSAGIITGGGFETPAEALYMGKKLMSIPIRGQYEQRCNAAALSQMGVTVLDDADTDHFAKDISDWLNLPKLDISLEANNIMETLERIFELSKKINTTEAA